MQRIFRLYTRDRVGTRAVANTFSADGHRTKSGKPWSGAAVLTVLRNRVYRGEVFYRDQWHKADPHHPRLVSAEQVLIARGDDHTHRTGARSHFPLAGLIFWARCGKRYQGTTARGSRYYTCFTRPRYGTTSCPAERLPAEQVEHGVVDSLLATLAGTDPDRRRTGGRPRRSAGRPRHARRRTRRRRIGDRQGGGVDRPLPHGVRERHDARGHLRAARRSPEPQGW